ncbi:unnamed protein product, partial [Chrysoparadoxa australica]
QGGNHRCVAVVNADQPLEELVKATKEAVDFRMKGEEEEEEEAPEPEINYSSFPPNAFAVTLFCLEEAFESRAIDFLPHMFKLFKDRDYCILMVPSVGAEAVLLKHFIPVPPKPGSTFSHVLYIMHRDSLPAYKYLKVSRYDSKAHKTSVARLLEFWDDSEGVQAAVKAADAYSDQPLSSNPPTAAFVATLGHQVIGAIVADRASCSVDDIAWLKGNYHVEDFIAFERHKPRSQAKLIKLVLNPIFQGHCRFLLKEIMRLYDKSVLFWMADTATDLPHAVPTAMVPVRPRQRMQEQPGAPLPLWKAPS